MKILIIRRDNIGDLILTTPLIETLSQAYNTKIDVLVNTYNKSVLENNPYVGRVHLYSKLHHRKPGQSALSVIINRIKTYIDIRLSRYDVAIIAREEWNKRTLPWAKLSKARRIIAIGDQTNPSITDLINKPEDKQHIVELLSRLAIPLGIHTAPGPLKLYPTKQEMSKVFCDYAIPSGIPVYGLQISARKPMQRWQADKFFALAKKLSEREECHLMLLWSPGKADNKLHPGDDEQAEYIISQCRNLPVTAVKTNNIRELMAAMSHCDQILTSDGGALHIAVGVGKPVVALFGNSDAWFWGPWKVPCKILLAPEQNVSLLGVEEVFDSFLSLRTHVVEMG